MEQETLQQQNQAAATEHLPQTPPQSVSQPEAVPPAEEPAVMETAFPAAPDCEDCPSPAPASVEETAGAQGTGEASPFPQPPQPPEPTAGTCPPYPGTYPPPYAPYPPQAAQPPVENWQAPPAMPQGYPGQDAPENYPPYPPAYAPPPWAQPQPFGRKPKDPLRRAATRKVNLMSLLVLAQTGFSFLWSGIFLLIMTFVGLTYDSNTVAGQLYTGAMVPLSTALPFGLYLLISKNKASDFLKFKKVGFFNALPCVIGGTLIVLLGNYPALLVKNLLNFFGGNSSGNVDTVTQPEVLLLQLAITGVLVPIMEEFVFRGVLLSALRRFGNGFALFVSTLLFALVHLDLSTVVFAAIAGLVLGFLYLRTENLWVNIAVHMYVNLYAVFSSNSQVIFGEWGDMIAGILYLVTVVLGIVSLVRLSTRRDRWLTAPLTPAPLRLSAEQSIAAAFSSVALWGVVLCMVWYTGSLFFL